MTDESGNVVSTIASGAEGAFSTATEGAAGAFSTVTDGSGNVISTITSGADGAFSTVSGRSLRGQASLGSVFEHLHRHSRCDFLTLY